MSSSMSKRSCPIRQLSLQQDLHTNNKPKRNPPLQKQKSHDAAGSGINSSHHVKLHIRNTRFSRALTPDMEQSRPKSSVKVNTIHQSKPKPIKVAWSDKKSVSLKGQDEDGDGVKVQVIAKKCKEIPRPFTAKPKIELGTKNTILYTREELADRLKLAIEERQSRKQNLDIFLAQNVNNDHHRPKPIGLFRTNNLTGEDFSTTGDQQNNNVLDFNNKSTSFVPYDGKVSNGGGFGMVTNGKQSSRTNVNEQADKKIISMSNYNLTSSIDNSSEDLCNTCVEKCTATKNTDSMEETGSFLMASSPCLHGKEDHQPADILKFKQIFNIEKQRPFSVRVIDDKIDIFNDDEDNDSLLMIDSDNDDCDSLSSSVEIDDAIPTQVPSQVSIESKKESAQNIEQDVGTDEIKTPSKVPASERRNMFKNSCGRNKNNLINQTIKGVEGLGAKRSRLIRMSSAPSTNANKAHLKRQTSVTSNSQEIQGGKFRADSSQDSQKVIIPTISITDESDSEQFRDVRNRPVTDIKFEKSHNKENNNKYSERSKLVLRKQNSIIHFSSDLSADKSFESKYQPLTDTRTDHEINQFENHSYNTERETETAEQFENKDERKSASGTFPILSNKFTIQRQNSKPNKISFQSTLTNYMKNETNMMKPILTNSYDVERSDRIKSAIMMANKKKLKFSKKKFHKSLDDITYEHGVNTKKLTRIPSGRDVVTMVSLLSDESDVECDTPEPCSMVVHHPPTLAIVSQPVEDRQGKHCTATSVSTFQVCLRKPADKPVTLPVQTSSSGRNYSTLYPSRRGPGFDASSPSTNSIPSFSVQSSSSPQVSAAFQRKQTRVKSASICSSSKSNSEIDKIFSNQTQNCSLLDSSNEMPSETPPSSLDHPVPEDPSHTPATDVEETIDMPPPINLVITLPNATHENSESTEGLKDNQNESDDIGDTKVKQGELFDNEMDMEKPPIFNTPKEQDCWIVFQKMAKKGINVSYDTILRGMLTPTEYRLHKKCNAATLERSDSLGDNFAVI